VLEQEPRTELGGIKYCYDEGNEIVIVNVRVPDRFREEHFRALTERA
jgi:hypothetical protein